jgi:polyferredoxin
VSSCKYDTDGDGDCHLCCRLPDGCPYRQPEVHIEHEKEVSISHDGTKSILERKHVTILGV